MILRTTTALAFALTVLPATAGALELQFPDEALQAAPHDWLAEPSAVPASLRGTLDDALAGEIESAFAENVQGFAHDLQALTPAPASALAGGGQGDVPANGALAFILGFIPGFGLGHFLFSNDTAGGTRWLIIDIVFLVVWVVLDAVLFNPFGPLYFLWWLGDVILPLAWVVEHVFQGLDAYRAATGRRLVGAQLEGVGELAAEPAPLSPNVFSVRF